MIGFFDSGFGGMTVFREVMRVMPECTYIYLGDNARTPYGSRSGEIIYEYTREGVEELFKRGCVLVVLACNTASAVALRKLQQEYLPQHWPDRKVLGIIIPTAEEMREKKGTVGIFATEATVQSRTFPIEIAKHNPEISVAQQACPLLVPIIEAGEFDQLDAVIEKYVRELFASASDIHSVILGCTHYALVEHIFKKYIPLGVEIISQPRIVTEKLHDYLRRHPEIESRLNKDGRQTFFTTETSDKIQNLAEMFYGEKIQLQSITIDKQ